MTKLISIYRAPHSRSNQYHVQIDAQDWPIVRRYRWCQRRSKRRNAQGRLRTTHVVLRYVCAKGRQRKVYLHRELMGASPDERVLFNDGNGLNCCRDNLCVVEAP